MLNSGLPQGKVLKRHVVTKAGGSTPIGPDDFAIGGSVALYGRSLKLNACNDFTRVRAPAAAAVNLCACAYICVYACVCVRMRRDFTFQSARCTSG